MDKLEMTPEQQLAFDGFIDVMVQIYKMTSDKIDYSKVEKAKNKENKGDGAEETADVLNSLQFMQDYGVNLICIEDGMVVINDKLMDLFGGPFFTPLFREGGIPMVGRKPKPNPVLDTAFRLIG